MRHGSELEAAPAERRFGLYQPGVSLSNFALFGMTAGFAGWLAWAETGLPWLRWSAVALFATLGLGALAGGLVHGLYPDPESRVNRRLWRLTQITLGLSAVALWIFAARLGFTPWAAALVGLAAAAAFCGHLAVIMFWSDAFLVTILHYLPALLFLAAVLVWLSLAEAAGAGLLGLVAVGLSSAAAAVQAFKFSPAPERLHPNTIYHGLQGVALILLFIFIQVRLAV